MKPTQTYSQERYSSVAIILHWLIAALLIAELALGLWMVDLPKTPSGLRAGWFNLHKSIGITLGVLILLRIGWRLMHTPPTLPNQLSQRDVSLAKYGHLALYLTMFIVPTSGLLGSAFSKYPIQYFGYALPKFADADEQLKSIFSEVHYYAICVLIALITIHLLAIIKHSVVDKINLLGRMKIK